MQEQLDYLETSAHLIDYATIQKVRQDRQAWFDRDSNAAYREALKLIAPFPAQYLSLDRSVCIGKPEELSPEQTIHLQQILQTFIPWRKGPFEIFGIPIDAEWKSDLKWERVLPFLEPLQGKTVADIGCNNGYYMFRMAVQKPEMVIGFDPTVRHWYTFQFLQQFAQLPQLHFELLGIEHMGLFPKFFDTVFCMGILYHHPDPIGMLRKIRSAMKVGGQLIVESTGIPGEGSLALFPEKRYAKVPGTWFVPTQSCLIYWLQRAGFREVELFYAKKLTTEEQRRTAWAPYESLEDFLDPEDPSLTVEGYPAPWRFYAQARKTHH